MPEENPYQIISLESPNKKQSRKSAKPDPVEDFTYKFLQQLIPPATALGMAYDCALWVGGTALIVSCIPQFILIHSYTPILCVLALFLIAGVIIFSLKVVPSASYLLFYRAVLFASGIITGAMSNAS